MRLRITKVDPYGYNGREYHPTADHEGKTAVILRTELWWFSETGDEYQNLTTLSAPVELKAQNLRRVLDTDHHEEVYIAVTEPDGELLELIGHEVELLTETSVGLAEAVVSLAKTAGMPETFWATDSRMKKAAAILGSDRMKKLKTAK